MGDAQCITYGQNVPQMGLDVAAVLYWSTMYLSHHRCRGAWLMTAYFLLFAPEDLRNGYVNGTGDKYDFQLKRDGSFRVGMDTEV